MHNLYIEVKFIPLIITNIPHNTFNKILNKKKSFLKNFSGHNSPINAMAINEDGVLVSCGDNGSINFWDYETGYCFQKSNTIVQPGFYLFLFF
jgi:WD40 repeat protein